MLWWVVDTTVMATALAGMVIVVCRLGHLRPAVRHALWLIVLLKLLTPPIFTWRLPLPDWGRHVRAAVLSQASGLFTQAPDSADVQPPAPAFQHASTEADNPRSSVPIEASAPVPPSAGAPAADAPALSATLQTPLWFDPARVATLVLYLWLGSAALVALFKLIRIQRFRRLLVWNQPAPAWLMRQVAELAAKLRVWPPFTMLIPGLVSPCLWCLGRPKLLLPVTLLERLTPESRPSVLVHELAHLRRRDHWVSWLQLIAMCLWWWNPLFWYVRRKIHENGELACDAWVAQTLPGSRRAYAEALIEVSRRVSSPAVPGLILGMGSRSRRAFEGRLVMIMQEPRACRVPLWSMAAIGLLALAALPGWTAGQKNDSSRIAAKASTDPKDAALEAALVKARVDGKYEMLLRQIYVPDDVDNYAEFNDFGLYQGASYAGFDDLPNGYWVYVEPYWYIWRDLGATPKQKRPWGPEQATGAPDTDEAGDIQTAWASRTPDEQDEWLLLEYAEPVVPKEVHVYETYNPGALYKVTAFNLDGTEVEIWQGQDPTPVGSDSGISKVRVKAPFKTNRIKIYLASKAVPGWNEIDAVGIVDVAGKTNWARSADASSTYAEPRVNSVRMNARMNKRPWGPEQVTGPPDTPEAGDFGTAWASLTPDGQDEWLQTEYATPVTVKEVHVYETFNPGALYKVSVFKADGTEIEVWKGKDPTRVGSAKGISVIPIKVNFKTKRVKIYLASKEVPGWNEIDAIGIKDSSNHMHWAVSATASSTYAQPMVVLDTGFITQEQAAAMNRIAELERENKELKKVIQQLKEKLKTETDDAEFVRRLYLDLIGTPPTAKQVQEFLKDVQVDKRQRLIDRLLEQRTSEKKRDK
jgi:beta-lactamase regulating signal transducer with metallopeptidase domain